MVYEGSRDAIVPIMQIGFKTDENNLDEVRPVINKYLTFFNKV